MYINLKIYCDVTNMDIATRFVKKQLLTLQFFSHVQYDCSWSCGRHPSDILIHPQFVQESDLRHSYSVNSTVMKVLKVHWHGLYVQVIFHKSSKLKVHGREIGWSGWRRYVATTTYPPSRECLLQVPRHIAVIVGRGAILLPNYSLHPAV
jgi:hypothetical protein